jgi:ubiquinone/menaquinone biosynthesis C-methylase UbiE
MPYETAAAKKQFESWSRHYDWNLLQPLFFGPAHKMLLQALLPSDQQILDVGCGTGLFAAKALAAYPRMRLWAMDLSGGMLRQCHKRCGTANESLHLVQGDSQRLPFPDDMFDAITCTHSFHHYPKQEQVAQEMFPVLRPGGRWLIIDGDPSKCWGRLVYDGFVVLIEGPVRHLTGIGFRNLYRNAGFERVEQKRRGGPLPFLLTIGCAEKRGRLLERTRRAA